jgi:hypothetical protein
VRLVGAIAAACVIWPAAAVAQAGAPDWNDSRSRALVELATTRRAEQLADTGLADYSARARGFVTFLVQLGEGFLGSPRIIKADELALEIYWKAPDQSKQRIIGRRDTTLMPTDIEYHRDHLGIVQNNFPEIIRLGDGEEVRDVPHPLSPAGLREYDFAISDSLRMALPGRPPIDVYEVKVRPRNDRLPRVIGALYIEKEAGQVVRMAFSFTSAAFLDRQLEELSVVLVNRLVEGRYWLPSQQEIEIRRSATWMQYPVRTIIRGRWEIGGYNVNVALGPVLFTGPEIVDAPRAEMERFQFEGRLLEILPPDVRVTTDEDVRRVQAEARALVRAQALSRPRPARFAARTVSDILRYNRFEGIAVGAGVGRGLGVGTSVQLGARYGVDDRQVRGGATLRWERASGPALELAARRDLRELADVPQRSTVMNSLLAQEFGDDATDLYGVDALSFRMASALGIRGRGALTLSAERHASLAVTARPASGTFDPAMPVDRMDALRAAVELDWAELAAGGGTLDAGVTVRVLAHRGGATGGAGGGADDAALPAVGTTTMRAALRADWTGTIRGLDVVSRTHLAAVTGAGRVPLQELVFLGGPGSAPGYALHALAGRAGGYQRIEAGVGVPFVRIPLGRFGEIPPRATIAPFAQVAGIADVRPCPRGAAAPCMPAVAGLYPSVGVSLGLIFDLLRVDVARSLRSGGGWMLNVDVARTYWPVL